MNAAIVALLGLLGAFPGPAAAAQPPTAALVVEQRDAGSRKLARLIEQRLEGKARLRWIIYAEDQLGDPIYKGRVVAELESARLVVAIGDEASQLVLNEVEQAPVYFVSDLAAGRELAESRTSGLLSYNIQDVLSALPAAWKQGLGLLYTPGYESIVGQIRGAAKGAGARLRERKVGRASELPSAARALMESSRAVWVLGDPLLSRGAGLEYLVEQSLSQSVPLIGSGPTEVRQGAALCSRAGDSSLAQVASTGIAGLLISRPATPRIQLAEPGGSILYNAKLQARFGLSPRPPSWEPLP